MLSFFCCCYFAQSIFSSSMAITNPVERQKKQTLQTVFENAPILNPKTTKYEFGGPIGAIGMIVGLPILVLFLVTCCDSTGYPSQAFREDWKSTLLSKFTAHSLFDPSAFLVYLGFVATLGLFYVVLPGNMQDGTTLRDGSNMKYKLNGIYTPHFAPLYSY